MIENMGERPLLPPLAVSPLEVTPLEDSKFAVHLQWFAAEDEGRTEEPTEQKIRKSREEGKVAKSSELSSSVTLLFPVIAIGILAPYMLRTMEEMVSYFFTVSTTIDVASDSGIVGNFLSYFLKLFLPPALIAFVAALLGNILQVGFLFSVKPITPDLSKIAPNFPKFLQRSFFSGEALFNLAKSIMKVIVIGIIVAVYEVLVDVDAYFVDQIGMVQVDAGIEHGDEHPLPLGEPPGV